MMIETIPEPTKKGWKEFDPELREMAQAILVSDRLSSEEIHERLESIMEGMGESDASRVKSLFTGYVSDGMSAVSTGEEGSEKRALMKKILTADTLFSGLKTGAGLMQIIDASAKKKKLSAPTFPEDYRKNDQLSAEITKAIYQSEQGDPKMQKFYESKVAEANDIDNYRAKVSGQIGQYAANIQGNALDRSKKLGEFAMKNEEIKRGGRDRIDRLLQIDIGEDKFKSQQQRQDYRTQRGEYERSVADLQAQKNSGFNNVFKGLDGIVKNAPFLSSIPGEPPNRTIPEAAKIGSSATGYRREIDIPSPDSGTVQNYDIGLLGNDHYRNNEKLVANFRAGVGSRNEGPWGPDDEDLRKRLVGDELPDYMR